MKQLFYSPSRNGFFDADIHGARFVRVSDDPAWERPRKNLTLAPGESAVGADGVLCLCPADTSESLVIEVLDMDAEPPSHDEPNPACSMPADVVAITEAEHRAILDGQATGKLKCAPGPDGKPTLVPQLTPEQARSAAVEQVRVRRVNVMRDLDGLQISAQVTGRTKDAQALEDVKEALRSLPDLDLSAAQDVDAAFAAISGAVRQHAKKAPAAAKALAPLIDF